MTTTDLLPTDAVMLEAFLGGDRSFDGIFWTGVRTTGIFCRPSCPARKPKPENVSFFAHPREALQAGYRPCKRCRPLEVADDAPDWLRPLLAAVDDHPARRWTDQDLRARGLAPERVRRWFRSAYGMTFQAYTRARRLGAALTDVQGGRSVASAAFDAGYDSLSGFHEAFRSYFGAAPTELDGARVVRITRLPTPLGPMLAGVGDEALHLLEFTDRRMLESQIGRLRRRLGAVFVPDTAELTERLRAELGGYFAGTRTAFDLPLDPVGSGFQHEVWARLAEIPYGETRSYADIAAAVGRPNAVRAVGTANGANPIAVVVPCHRVVASDGSLSGYGGGVWRKRRLLELERGGLDRAGDGSARE